MALSRKLLTSGAIGVAAFALIGVGASATFTDAVHANQTVTAGTIGVTITNAAGTLSADGKTITLPPVGPVGSTFETSNGAIWVTNTGNVTVTAAAFQLGQTTNGSTASAYLRDQLNVCIKSTDSSGTWVEANGRLMTGVNLVPSVVENPITLAPGESMPFSVNFYAGKDSACGTVSSDGPNTASRWGSYVTPASLTNAAQGGVVTPTLTFSFTG
jgi:predicted ribosomally synthesized peptide with SipW-like signal peptide